MGPEKNPHSQDNPKQKTNNKNKQKAKGIMLPDFKLYIRLQ